MGDKFNPTILKMKNELKTTIEPTLEAYVQHGKWGGPYLTEKADQVASRLLWWQEKGLMETASGYGSKLVTSYVIKYRGRWRRVYCLCYSNSGTLYIIIKGEKIKVKIY